jgi:diaminohydroxyphosphoribosylaminopyrimidine deaminase/5-amino-6-(5-phosphoribosylamino)uracil reductase
MRSLWFFLLLLFFMFNAKEIAFMQEALCLAQRGVYTTHPNPRVGCVIVKEDQVVGRGFHAKAGEPHAEIHALAEAKARARGATAYVTLEPCAHFGRTPPCSQALIAAGVAEVVIANRDPNPLVAGRGIAQLQAAGIVVREGLLAEQGEQLNRGFFSRMRRHRPWLRLKSASSLDGKIALANGQSQWISDAAARADVQRYRGKSHAILSSAATVLADNARLTLRLSAQDLNIEQKHWRAPLRIIWDRQGRLMPDLASNLLSDTTAVWLYQSAIQSANWPDFVQVIPIPTLPEIEQLPWLLTDLGKRGINSVQVEAGGRLLAAFWEAKLVDEWLFYLAPCFLGQGGQSLLQGKVLQDMAEVWRLPLAMPVAVGHTWRLSFLFTREIQSCPPLWPF